MVLTGPSYFYNGVYVQMCQTLQFSVVQIRDPSGTDAILTKYTIKVRGFLAHSQGSFPGIGDTLSSAEFLNGVKNALETPRRAIQYQIGSTVLVATDGMDAKIGPDPIEATVFQPVAGGPFMVECGAVVYTVECDNQCEGTRSPVLSLRWSQTESFDQNWYSHLSTEGRLIVRSDLLQSADNFRPLATPPLLNDYQRISSKYKLSPDGLELQFNFEDVEFDRLPPFPATKASGEYTVVVEKPGWRRIGQVHIRLEGQKGASRKALLNKAISMGYSKLRADQLLTADVAGKATAPIIWGTFKEDLFVPVVDVTMTAYMTNIIKKGFAGGGGGGFASLISSTFNAVGNIAGKLNAVAAGGVAGGALAGGLPPGGAVGPVPPGGGAGAFPGAVPVVAAAIAAAGAVGGLPADEPPPAVMPSVGMLTEGLAYNQPGIKPPDRKRLAGLLTAMFRDPCACLVPEKDVELRSGPNPATFTTNQTMLLTTPNGTTGIGKPPGTSPGSTPNLSTSPGTNNPATITVGPLSPDTSNQPPVIDNAPYDTWQMETEYQNNTGQVLMPGTGVGTNGGIGAAVTVHGGWMHFWVTWVAGRTGKPPVVPTFFVNDPNVIPLHGTVVAQDVVESPDGSQLTYLSSGYYVYGIKDPVGFQLVPGVAPFLSPQVGAAAQEQFHSFSAQIANNSQTGVPGAPSGTNPLVPDGVTPNQPPAAPALFDGPDDPAGILAATTAAGAFPYGNLGTYYFFNPPVKP